MLRYLTAGESHGKCLIAVVEGLPYGMPVDLAAVNAELARRQGGPGRGARQKMEKDEAEILTGIRGGHTIGSPLTLRIDNRVANIEELGPITRPRPGHADLAGAMKFGIRDARDVSERSSARETAARVAVGALAGALLRAFGIDVVGTVVEMGGVAVENRLADANSMRAARAQSEFFTQDARMDAQIRARVDKAREAGDTLGGIFEVAAFGVPPGLGTHASWTKKLDGRLARALMSIQSVKGVEVGLGFDAARRPGSRMHDEIVRDGGRLRHRTNNAGGIEGGMTNGEPVVVRAACKPIPSLRTPLQTVDLQTGQAAEAHFERSDVAVVPAASVVGEAAVAFELAGAFLDSFGADSWEETRNRFAAFQKQLPDFGSRP